MGKNIVICSDGTGKEYERNNTNVVKLFDIVDKSDPGRQIAYYDPGVGTMSIPGALMQTSKAFTKLMGLAFAYGITRNIEDSYRYLMDTFEPDDRVFLFGFSRGAFTVRALAGMLNWCGLLEKGSENLVPYASRMYRKGDSALGAGFKRTFSRECKPKFVGVWDTVESVGLVVRRKFPNARLNSDVSFGRHAISIDERRSKFRPNLWDPPVSGEQDIRQVWFAGVHSDVGGGLCSDSRLPDIALEWMLDEAEKQGLIVDAGKRGAVSPNHLDPISNSLLPVWWVLGWRRRRLPDDSLVHGRVFDKVAADPDYDPPNLRSADGLQRV